MARLTHDRFIVECEAFQIQPSDSCFYRQLLLKRARLNFTPPMLLRRTRPLLEPYWLYGVSHKQATLIRTSSLLLSKYHYLLSDFIYPEAALKTTFTFGHNNGVRLSFCRYNISPTGIVLAIRNQVL